MEKLLKVTLKIKVKNGGIRVITFEKVTDLFIDYTNNKLSLFDYQAGCDYKYHFRETGKERDFEATDILSIEIKEAK